MARTLEEFIAAMSPEAQAAVALETERLLKETRMSEISITLTPHFTALIEAKVQSGRYSDAGDVLREALRLFEQHEREREARLRDLQAAIDEGLASGESRPFSTYGTLGALLDASVRWHG
jgi:antitoxin ParD1/3/4